MFATQYEDIDDARTVERLFAILDGLDQAKREVFVLYEMEQRSMIEIAEALGVPASHRLLATPSGARPDHASVAT